MVRKRVFTDLPPEMVAFYRAASARRRRQDKACEVCGTPMSNVILKRRYCSGKCAVKAWRQRKAAAPTPPAAPPGGEP